MKRESCVFLVVIALFFLTTVVSGCVYKCPPISGFTGEKPLIIVNVKSYDNNTKTYAFANKDIEEQKLLFQTIIQRLICKKMTHPSRLCVQKCFSRDQHFFSFLGILPIKYKEEKKPALYVYINNPNVSWEVIEKVILGALRERGYQIALYHI